MPRDPIGEADLAPPGIVAGAAGATLCLSRPDLGLWAVVAPGDDPQSRRSARELRDDLAILDGALDEARLERALRLHLEREAARPGWSPRPDGDAGVSAAIVLLRPPGLLCLRLGGCSAHRLGRAGLARLAAPADADGPAPDPGIETIRVRLEAGDRVVLGTPVLQDIVERTGLMLERLPPDAAARLLVQRAEGAGRRGGGAVVLALPDRLPVAAKPAAVPLPSPSGPAGPRPRIPPLAIGAATALALSVAAVIGIAVLRAPTAPDEATRAPEASPQEEIPAATASVSGDDLAAADRRLTRAVRLAIAIAATDQVLGQLDLPPPIASGPAAAIRPFAPAGIDAQARALAARLPGWPLAVPLHVPYRLSSPFGMRVHPITGVPTLHAGQDMAAPQGTPIFAAGDGRVLRAGPAGGYGNLVEIQHADGLVTRYGHMLSVEVVEGQAVTPATEIGLLGSTGDSTGPHLHYEIRRGAAAVDPMPFLQAGQSLKSILAAAILE